MRLAKRVGRLSPSPTMAVSEEANRLRSEGRAVVDFSIGEPDFNTPDNIKGVGHRPSTTTSPATLRRRASRTSGKPWWRNTAASMGSTTPCPRW